MYRTNWCVCIGYVCRTYLVLQTHNAEARKIEEKIVPKVWYVLP